MSRGSSQRQLRTSALVPPGWKAAWKTPARGFEGANPRLALVIQADFPSAASLAAAQLPSMFSAILEAFGDHEVTIYSDHDPKQLFAMDWPWHSVRLLTKLKTTVGTLAADKFWSHARSLLASGMTIEAVRGGGAYRHEVWYCECDRPNSHAGTSVSFRFSGVHLAEWEDRRADNLALAILSAAAQSNAHYGRAEVEHRLGYSIADAFSGAPPSSADLWEASPLRSEPLVPWVYSYNLLSKAHLDRLGSLEEPCSFCDPYEYAQTVNFPQASIITCRKFSDSPNFWTEGVGSLCSPSQLSVSTSPASLWLLFKFAQASMLTIQHSERIHTHLRDEYSRPARHQTPPVPETQTPLPDFKDHAPRCIQTSATFVPPAQLRSPLSELGSHAAVFEILRPNSIPGLTIYSSQSHDDDVRFLVGSNKPDRAALYFNALLHGWNGETNKNPKRVPPARLTQTKCPRCDGRHFAVFAGFEPDDHASSLTGEDRLHPQDFFTWFWLHARCVACNWQDTVADVECA
jgi:hypothetical protein